MNCQNCQSALPELLLDPTAASNSEARAHMESCAPCREEVALARSYLRDARRLERLPSPRLISIKSSLSACVKHRPKLRRAGSNVCVLACSSTRAGRSALPWPALWRWCWLSLAVRSRASPSLGTQNRCRHRPPSTISRAWTIMPRPFRPWTSCCRMTAPPMSLPVHQQLNRASWQMRQKGLLEV